jgi:hypothetical protein
VIKLPPDLVIEDAAEEAEEADEEEDDNQITMTIPVSFARRNIRSTTVLSFWPRAFLPAYRL